MTLELWILIMVEIGALAATALPIIIGTGADHWWNNFIGRYLMYQSVGFALILLYAGYGQLAFRFHWSPLPQSQLILLSIFALIASIKVFGVVTFLRVRLLSRRTGRTGVEVDLRSDIHQAISKLQSLLHMHHGGQLPDAVGQSLATLRDTTDEPNPVIHDPESTVGESSLRYDADGHATPESVTAADTATLHPDTPVS